VRGKRTKEANVWSKGNVGCWKGRLSNVKGKRGGRGGD
jgi:hypothetical protein